MKLEDIRKKIVKKVQRVVLKLGSYVLTTPSWKLDRKVLLAYEEFVKLDHCVTFQQK